MLVDTLQTTQENCIAFVQNINFLLLTLIPNYLHELTYKLIGRGSAIDNVNNLKKLLEELYKKIGKQIHID